jgi:hypothetical protein
MIPMNRRRRKWRESAVFADSAAALRGAHRAAHCPTGVLENVMQMHIAGFAGSVYPAAHGG